jgi:isopropylmalate/homocitrate/citramalate synthase
MSGDWVDYLTSSGSTSPEVGNPPARELEIYDVTLRDGEQQAGVVFSVEQKLTIFAALDAIGVPVIETGMVAASQDELLVARRAGDSEHRARVFVLARAVAADVELAASAGVDGVTIETISNPVVAEKVFGWDPSDPRDKAIRAVDDAKSRELAVNLFLVDATRVPAAQLGDLGASICNEARPDTITIADTFGVANGHAMAAYVTALTEATGLPVYVHCHNEYGLAVANTCAGIEAGAFGAHTSVNGMGERAGNAALEDVVMAGRGPYCWETGIDPAGLTDLSALVAELSEMVPARNKSAVGSDLFAIESGVAAAFYEALQGAEIGQFYAYTPESMGADVRILVGKGSGAANLRLRAAGLGSDELRERAAELLPQAKQLATEQLGELSDEQLLGLLAR